MSRKNILSIQALGRLAGLLLAAGLLASTAAAGATLVLKDGAVIHGEITSLEDGVYRVNSPTLGKVRVRKVDVRTIDHSGGATLGAGAAPTATQQEVQSLQTQMMQDPNMMAKIQALQSDPQIQAVLADPEIMRAIASGDYGPLLNHPKIQALSRNAGVREIIKDTQ